MKAVAGRLKGEGREGCGERGRVPDDLEGVPASCDEFLHHAVVLLRGEGAGGVDEEAAGGEGEEGGGEKGELGVCEVADAGGGPAGEVGRGGEEVGLGGAGNVRQDAVVGLGLVDAPGPSVPPGDADGGEEVCGQVQGEYLFEPGSPGGGVLVGHEEPTALEGEGEEEGLPSGGGAEVEDAMARFGGEEGGGVEGGGVEVIGNEEPLGEGMVG
nr:hypothetical protein [Spirochaeta thermophila]